MLNIYMHGSSDCKENLPNFSQQLRLFKTHNVKQGLINIKIRVFVLYLYFKLDHIKIFGSVVCFFSVSDGFFSIVNIKHVLI